MDSLPRNIRILRDYWRGLANGQAPERSQIELDRLKPVLGYLLLVEFTDEPFRVRYRLVETIVDQMTGIGITGRYLDEFATGAFEAPVRYIESCYRTARQNGQPFIGEYGWPVESGVVITTLMGLFPLRIDGQIRQCLSIEDYGRHEMEKAPIDWRPALANASGPRNPRSVGEGIGDQDRVVPFRTRR